MFKNVTEFQTEITSEICGVENQLTYFWKAELCDCLHGSKICKKRKLKFQDWGHLNKVYEIMR